MRSWTWEFSLEKGQMEFEGSSSGFASILKSDEQRSNKQRSSLTKGATLFASMTSKSDAGENAQNWRVGISDTSQQGFALHR